MPRAAQLVTKTCAHCGGEFTVRGTARQLAREYCGRDCSNKATAAARGAAHRTSHGYVAPVCPCGKTIVPTTGRGYAYTKKYCDDECRRKYAPKRQRDESKWKTYACKNPDCGALFERRVNSRNQKLYCSLACSNKMTKKKHHIVIRDDDVVLDSGYEAFFYGACKIAKITIERFDRKYGVAWDDEHPDRWYAPDFWLPDFGVAVETKGYEDAEDRFRWAAFEQKTGYGLWSISGSYLTNLAPGSLPRLLSNWAAQRNRPIPMD